MKIVALMAVFLLCQIIPGHSRKVFRPCRSSRIFSNCSDYCNLGCNRGLNTCLRECRRGCACGETAQIMESPSECMALQYCTT